MYKNYSVDYCMVNILNHKTFEDSTEKSFDKHCSRKIFYWNVWNWKSLRKIICSKILKKIRKHQEKNRILFFEKVKKLHSRRKLYKYKQTQDKQFFKNIEKLKIITELEFLF